MKRFVIVAGARPNFPKVAPILRALKAYPGIQAVLIHTGQHYDDQLSQVFFDDFEIETPGYQLAAGSGTHAQQTAEVMIGVEQVLSRGLSDGPFDRVIVVGDVNSTLAAALAAAKLNIPVAHVEAGLRSFDRSMPEEINRIVTDAVADLWFVSEPAGERNLLAEGKPADRIHLVGNVMIDTLRAALPRAREQDMPARLGLDSPYGVVTFHRPSNVDDQDRLTCLVESLALVSQALPLVCLLHPRTRQRLQEADLTDQLTHGGCVLLLPPQGYLECLSLVSGAAVVITDSGGLQEESTALEIPCLTLRGNTERPITIEVGTNTLVGTDRQALLSGVQAVVDGQPKRGVCPAFWDGHAAERIASILTVCPV